jgi:hypothetical protein
MGEGDGIKGGLGMRMNLLFVGPLEKVSEGWRFRMLQPGQPAIKLSYDSKNIARENHRKLLKPRDAHYVPTLPLFMAIVSALEQVSVPKNEVCS